MSVQSTSGKSKKIMFAFLLCLGVVLVLIVVFLLIVFALLRRETALSLISDWQSELT